jgi:tetratricopeptide (TPR) repeat protein
VPVEDPSGRALRLELGRALAGSGRLEQARATLTEVIAAAQAESARAVELRAQLALLNLRAQTDSRASMVELEATAERALPELERLEDERGLASAWWLVHWARFRIGRYGDSLAAAELTVEHARRAGDRREELRALGAIAMATCHGPTPVADGLRRCEELVDRADGASLVEAFAARVRGFFLAMTGEFERGREECRRSVEIYEELGNRVSALGVVCELEVVERMSGRLDVAEEELRSTDARLREIGDVGYLSWVVPQLARILALRGKGDEAIELARRSRAEMQPDHAFGQVTARLAEAIALTAAGELEAAEEVALESLELVERTDALDVHADVLLALADLDRAKGRTEPALVRLGQAIELCEQKGDVVSAARAREQMVAA